MKEALRLVIFFIILFSLLDIGDFFVFHQYSNVSVFFPSAGFSFAILLLTDFRKWYAYLIAVFIASLAINLLDKFPVSYCFLRAITNAAQAFTAAIIVKRIIGMDIEISLKRIKDFFVIIVTGCFFVPAIFSFLGAYLEVFFLGAQSFWISYLSQGTGRGIGILVMAPFTIAWFQNPLPKKSWKYWLEMGFIVLLIAFFSEKVFGTDYKYSNLDFDMEYFFFIFPLIFWLTLRFEFRGITAASVVVNFIAIYYSSHHYGPLVFTNIVPLEQILHLEAFLSFITLAPLGLAIVYKERESGQQQLQGIIDYSPILFFAKGPEGKYIFINKKFEEFVNLSSDKIIGKTDHELFPKEFADSIITNDTKVLENNIPITYEQTISDKNGNHAFVVTKFPLKNTEGNTYALCSIATDITEYKHAEERFKLIVESSPNSMILVDSNRLINMINPQTEKIFGYRSEELVGKPIEILVPERSRAIHPALVEGYMKEPKARPLGVGRDLTGQRKDGTEVPIEISLNPMKIGGKTVVLASIIDITIRKQTIEALRLSEKRFSYVLAATQDSIYDWELEIGKLWRNEQYEKLFDGPSSSGQTDWWKNKIHPDDFENVNKNLQEIYKKHESIWNQEFRFMRADGGYANVIDRGFVIYNSEGKPTRMIGAIMDITERKKFIDELAGSLALTKATLESTPDGILVYDSEGKIKDYNKRFLEIWRIPESMLASKDDDQTMKFWLTQLKYPDKFIAKIKEVNKTPDIESFDVIEFLDGRILERYSRPQRADTKIIGRVWSYRDITERKKAQEVEKLKVAQLFLRQQEILKLTSLKIELPLEEKFKKIIETVSKVLSIERVSICLFDELKNTISSSTIYSLSQNTYLPGISFQRNEYPRFFQELDGIYVLDANDAMNDPRTSELYEHYLKPLTITSILTIPIRVSGKVIGIILNESLGSKRIWSYEEQGFGYSISDIITSALENEEKLKIMNSLAKSELEIRKNEERFRLFSELSNEAIVIHDKGIIIESNPTFSRMFGYDPSELKGMSVLKLATPGSAETVKKNIMIDFEGAYEAVGLRKDGSTFYGELKGGSINYQNKKMRMTIIRDITARKNAEEVEKKRLENIVAQQSELLKLSKL